MKKKTYNVSPLMLILMSGLLCAALLMAGSSHNVLSLRGGTPEVPFPKQIEIASSSLEAKAAVIYDPGTGEILYMKNSSDSLPLASLTKLMTAQAALTVTPGNTMVTITPDDLKPYGDWGFEVGDRVKLSDLVKFGLIASSNDAMAAVASTLGGDYLLALNGTAGKLGLSHTLFLNPTGLDIDDNTSGAYGSASDVARLAAVFLKSYPQYFELTDKSTVTIPDGNRTLSAAAIDVPLLGIPGFIGAKTGYTDLAGGNLVAAFDIDIGHPLIAVVLGSTEEGRFTDIKTLINAAREQNI